MYNQTSRFFRAWKAQIATHQLASAGRRSLCTLASLLAIVCLSFSFSATKLHAQGYGTISGTVTDPSGAVVTGATLTATEVQTGNEAKATSGKDGRFVFLDSSAFRLYDFGLLSRI